MSAAHVLTKVPEGQQQHHQLDGVPDGGANTGTGITARSLSLGPLQVEQSSHLTRSKPPMSAIMPCRDIFHNIPLHSPTPIVGTPFDVKAHFEYPFPEGADAAAAAASISPGSTPSNLSPVNFTVSRPGSASSQHILSSSPPPHMAKSISPPPLSSSFNYNYNSTHPKLRSAHTRSPPIPPTLIKRRRISASMRARSPSNESITTQSDGSLSAESMSSISWVSSVESSQDLEYIRERKKQREIIGDGSVDLGKSVRINEAEAVDAAAIIRREDELEQGEDTTSVPSEPHVDDAPGL